jgi:alkylation response protein AidB-like acyl-CoA dehydrogenase
METKQSSQPEKINEWLRNYGHRRINSRLIDERRCIPPYIVLDLAEQGLFGMILPPNYGGLGLSYQDMFLVIEQLAAIDLTIGAFVGLNNVLGIYPILKYAQDDIKNTYLRPLAEGRKLASFAITELGAGSNPRDLQTEARGCEDGGWIINRHLHNTIKFPK